jgi:cold shock CspA family protein
LEPDGLGSFKFTFPQSGELSGHRVVSNNGLKWAICSVRSEGRSVVRWVLTFRKKKRARRPAVCFVHISAVERAGLPSLNEGQVLHYDVVSNRGKEAAENLKAR